MSWRSYPHLTDLHDRVLEQDVAVVICDEI
jgi:hypothetical protein